MTDKSYDEMTGPELVTAFNAMVTSEISREHGIKPVQRFSDRAAALRRVQELAELKKKVVASPIKNEGIIASFGAREGSNLSRAIQCLADNFGQQVSLNALLKATYGNARNVNSNALGMVLKGVHTKITDGKLPYVVKREKNEKKEISYGLYRK